MIFEGEHLLPGIIGKIAVLMALIFSMAATVSYLILYFKNEKSKHLWRFSRLMYDAHFTMIALSVVLLFYIIFMQYFEYNYVWKHSSSNTPLKYMVSCFWAGQEGSFLTWILLQGITGFFIIRRAVRYESIAISVISLSQFLLIINILGFSFFGIQLGSSPFYLLREVSSDPLFLLPDYLLFITDGNGLNPLLQNPWMTIHPPLIFAGYALTILPYALIIASLVKNEYDNLKSIIFWVVVSMFFLGIGIIIGGAWAYEALTFGGFWSWDPVENASLVPWIILIAALHLLIVAHKKNYLLLQAYFTSVLVYVFVIYASFLTRSGILANTSAHAFGKDGFQHPVILMLLFFIALPFFLIILRRKDLYRKDSSTLFSQEFIMYAASIILLLSAFQIIFTTSIPVINQIFSLELTPPSNRESFYNEWQLAFAIVICLIIGIIQVINYKSDFLKKLWLPVLLSLILSFLLIWSLNIKHPKYILLIVTSIICIIFCLDFLIQHWKRTPNKTALITHIGFGVFILGALLTFSNKRTLINTHNALQKNETIILEKDKMSKAGKYYLFFYKKEKTNNAYHFNIGFYERMNDDTLKFAFDVKPYIVMNVNMGNVYEPYIKKFLLKDVFTYITYIDPDILASEDAFKLIETKTLLLKDTVRFQNSFIVLDSLIIVEDTTEKNQIDITALINIGKEDSIFSNIYPVYSIFENEITYKDGFFDNGNFKIRFKKVGLEENTIVVEISEKQLDYIVVKAIVFPYINLMWVGVIIMFLGLFISIIKRRSH